MQKDDLISRAAAIDILDAYQVMVENGEENPYAWARSRMSELPSAQPERKTGHWIEHIDSYCNKYGECSECGKYQKAGHLGYCPFCGAKMLKEGEG